MLLVVFRDDDQMGVFQTDACNYTTVRSTDLGRTWHTPTILPAGTVCPALAPLRQGRFYQQTQMRGKSPSLIYPRHFIYQVTHHPDLTVFRTKLGAISAT